MQTESDKLGNKFAGTRVQIGGGQSALDTRRLLLAENRAKCKQVQTGWPKLELSSRTANGLGLSRPAGSPTGDCLGRQMGNISASCSNLWAPLGALMKCNARRQHVGRPTVSGRRRACSGRLALAGDLHWAPVVSPFGRRVALLHLRAACKNGQLLRTTISPARERGPFLIAAADG